jgi:sugar-specific transcriptional regulator TrmB
LSYQNLMRLKQMLLPLGLTEYEALTLAYLALFGETKATTIAKATKIPSARIYETIGNLSRLGLLRTKPGRPAVYRAVSPRQAVDILVDAKKQELESMKKYADEFVDASQAFEKEREIAYTQSPLLRIVGLGQVSELETRRLYAKSRKNILILTRVGEYLTSFLEDLGRAAKRGVSVMIVFTTPQILSSHEREIQQRIVPEVKKTLRGAISLRFSPNVPLRGTIVDPNSSNAEALFFAQEADVAPMFREAALSSNKGLVTALALFFRFIWKDAKID